MPSGRYNPKVDVITAAPSDAQGLGISTTLSEPEGLRGSRGNACKA